MVTSHDFREILALTALIAAFSVALWVLPDSTPPPASVAARHLLPMPPAGAGVEKIHAPVHTLFATP